jgi:predicted phage terminase large subunit-like protein
MEWQFPTKARVGFAHMQYDSDVHDYQGAQIPLICFDQLEHFSSAQFWYMLSRNRSTCGVRPYVRATCNPDPDSFVADLVSWWIGEDGYALPERSGVVRWFVRVNETLEWADSAAELIAKYPDIPPKSLTFIPASVFDNKILMARDPGYLANLNALPLVDRMRLLGDGKRGGNWQIRPAAGKIFNRAWFEIVDAVPAGGVECRRWDFAATEKQLAKDDPDFTASARMRCVGGCYYITDCTAERIGPAQADTMVANISRQDESAALGTNTRYMVRWEQEPGSSGIRDTARLVRLLAGVDCAGVLARGDKLMRAKPLAAQSEAGNVKLLRGAWNEAWLRHMHNQPDEAHDDIMDASAGAFSDLARPVLRARSSQG